MKTAVAILGLVAVVLSACTRRDEPNVILVTLDTTRADRVGAMGRSEARTPVLDGLAARGVLYERAYASAPLTLPSHATMLTGLDPDEHGVRDNGRFVLAASIPTVTERLAARGYDTAAFVAAFVLDSSFGLERGFARYDDEAASTDDPLRFEVPRRRGGEVTDGALAWLGARRSGPFFLWAHYYDVHLPREPPPPYDAMPDSYDGALAYVDAEVGRLLDGAARAAGARSTLIVVVGDHGESLGEHDEESHGMLAYDAVLHVPLIVAGPGFPAGVRSRAFVRTVDIAPAILAAAGAPALPGASTRALGALPAVPPHDETTGYFECLGPHLRMGWARLAGVRDERWKYTAEPAPVELYDTIADPAEATNRATDEPAVVERLAGIWQARSAGIAKARSAGISQARSAGTAPAVATSGTARSPDVDQKLAALGYVDVVQQFPPDAVPDPRRFVGAVQLVDAARMLAVDGQVVESLHMLEALAQSPVARPLALASLAPLYLMMDRAGESVRAAEALVALTGGPAPRIMLARALLTAGRGEDALHAIEAAAGDAGAPSSLVRRVQARVLLQLDRPADAQAVLETDATDDEGLALASRARAAEGGAGTEIDRLQSIVRTPPGGARLVETRAWLATLLQEAGRDAEAVQVLEGDPHPPPEYRASLAEIAARHGNPMRAATLYESAIADRPAMQLYRRRLAELYGTLGRDDDALAEYDAMVTADPTNAALHVDRGAARAAVRRPAEAEEDYRRAIALDATLPEAYVNLALLELADGRDSAAKTHLERALELRPDYQKAHFHLARLYARQGDPRAREHAERAVGAAGKTAGE